MITHLLEKINDLLGVAFDIAAATDEVVWETALCVLPRDPRNLTTDPPAITAGVFPPLVWVYAAMPSGIGNAWIQNCHAVPPPPLLDPNVSAAVAKGVVEGLRQERTRQLKEVTPVGLIHDDHRASNVAATAATEARSRLILPGQ